MTPTWIFCIFLAFSVQVKAASQGRICVTDYWHTISCSLKLPITSARNISYWLEAHSIIGNQDYSCQLQRVHEDHICNFTVDVGFRSFDKYTMTLHYLENGTGNSSLLDASFKPAKNIKTKTPFNLTLQYANGTYHFFWKSGYEKHTFRTALPIIYEFKYYKDGDPTSEVIVHPEKEMIQTEEMKLDPDTMYAVMVKSKVDDRQVYGGTWSDWSSTVKWKTAYRGEYCGSYCSIFTHISNISLNVKSKLIHPCFLLFFKSLIFVQDEPREVSKIAIGMFAMVGLLILFVSIPAAR
ncbi:interleukin-21 receptor-like isoform X2 [Cyprinus carpio]|nr:interleukin-21 receptor-like isoform X2 [Cyprinus carpio]